MTMNSIYAINKGVNKPVVFKGLKAQYIWYLGIGLAMLLLLFALLYIMGIQVLICVLLIGVLGVLLFYYVYRVNHHYGEFGWMKKMAKRSVPAWVNCDQLFQL